MLSDLKHSFRQLGKTPGFTAVALVTLALGIGANTALFSVIHAVLLRSLPYAQPEQLAFVWINNERQNIPDDIASYPTFMDWKTQSTAFAAMAAHRPGGGALTGDGDPVEIRTNRVTEEFFTVLGAQPLHGRFFHPEEQTPGKDGVVIISHGLWQRRFGGDAAVLGRQLMLNGTPREIVGVLPPGFAFPEKTEIYVPLAVTDQLRANRNGFWLPVIGRLKPDTTLAHAQSELSTVQARIQKEFPSHEGYGVNVASMHAWVVRGIRPALLVLVGAVACVLLIACANIANLLLARAAVRRRELAVRAALGAGRWRIARGLLAESLWLAGLGGALGIVVAVWGLSGIKAFAAGFLPGADTIALNGTTLGFTVVISLLTGLGFGLAPAWQAARADPQEALKDGARGQTAGRAQQRVRRALVVAQTALALVLLAGAALLLRSFQQLQAVELGLDTDQVVTTRISAPPTKYANGVPVAQFHRDLVNRLAALPGVQAVGATSSVQMETLHTSSTFTIEGRAPEPEAQRKELPTDAITPGYLAVLRVPVVAGRNFTDADGQGVTPVALVNETFVRTYFDGRDPLGARFTLGDPQPDSLWLTIVGVVRDTHRLGPDQPVRMEAFFPHAQYTPRGMEYVVRSPLALETLNRMIREAAWSIDRDLPVPAVELLSVSLDQRTAQRRLNTVLLSLFAGLALLLAGLGLYSVLAYNVAQRTGEIGVRMALGAQPGDVLRLIIGEGLRLAAAGVIIGLAAAFALARTIESLLFQTEAHDPVAFAAIAALLAIVALFACWLPAQRATRVDPMTALRTE